MPFPQFSSIHPDSGGIRIAPADPRQAALALPAIQRFLSGSGLGETANCSGVAGAAPGAQAWLNAAFAAACMPDHDTTGVAQALNLCPHTNDTDLDLSLIHI